MDLILSKSVMDLIVCCVFLCVFFFFWGGGLFHNFGAIFSKALSPNVLDFTHISERRFFFTVNKDCDLDDIA